MPISQLLNPQELRAEGVLSFRDIPLNAYRKTLRDVKGEFPEKDLHDIFYDMRLIREFETMLYSIRLTKVYHDIEYSYTGPAHLSTGQEASSVCRPMFWM